MQKSLLYMILTIKYYVIWISFLMEILNNFIECTPILPLNFVTIYPTLLLSPRVINASRGCHWIEQTLARFHASRHPRARATIFYYSRRHQERRTFSSVHSNSGTTGIQHHKKHLSCDASRLFLADYFSSLTFAILLSVIKRNINELFEFEFFIFTSFNSAQFPTQTE